MKKIFLTSGIIVCMACPAFATGSGFTAAQGSGIQPIANACVVDYIGVTSGTTNLKAKWTQGWTEITLNNNAVNKGYGGTTGVSGTKLYGVFTGATGSNQVYNTKNSITGNLSGGQGVNGSSLLTRTPVGKSIAFAYNYQFPTDSSTGQAYTASSSTFTAATASTAAVREFQGFFDNANGTGNPSTTNKQFLSAAGKLTSDGLSAAQAGTPTTWYAQYALTCPTVGTPSLTGYTFNGWKLASSDTDTITLTSGRYCIADGDTASDATSNKTLYAKWTPNNYSITLSKTSGASDGSPTSLLTTFDTGVYTTARDSSHQMTKTSPTDNQKVTVPTGLTINLTYNLNLPTPAGGTQYAASALTTGLSGSSPDTAVRPFQGYVSGVSGSGTAQNGTGTTYIDANGVITDDGLSAGKKVSNTSTTWYAKWGDASFTVKPALVLTGYTFNGWFTAASGGTQKTSASTYSIFSDSTLYAQWTANKYNVIYHKGAHNNNTSTSYTGYTHSNGATFDKNYSVPADSDTASTVGNGVKLAHTPATGYSFIGWSTDENATVTRTGGNSTTPSNTGTVSSAFTGYTPWKRTSALDLYAIYQANQIKVTYSCGTQPGTQAQTGTVPAAKVATYDSTFTHAANTCAYDGWTFNGWSCTAKLSSNDSSTTYTSGATTGTVTATSNITCTAQWTAKTITLKWNTNNGTPSTLTDGSCTYEGSVTLPTNPTRTGYTFNGWEVANGNN